MEIVYNNSIGSVNFRGGGDFPFRLTDIDGLWLTSKTFSTVKYSGMPGQDTTEVSESARTITLGGDLQMDHANSRYLLSLALTVLNTPGALLFYYNDGRILKIDCQCSAVEAGERNRAFQKFSFQFICDSPYFTDLYDTHVPLYKITGLLDDSFTFPGAFSTAVIGGELYYTGTAKTEPVITITVHSTEEYPENGFYIENQTTGQKIQLDYIPTAGDVITLDIPNRKIYKHDGTDLLPQISDDTFLDGFTLMPGANILEVLQLNVNMDAYMECAYKNKYLEAVY